MSAQAGALNSFHEAKSFSQAGATAQDDPAIAASHPLAAIECAGT